MMKGDSTLGGRLPLAELSTMTGEQRALFDSVTANQVPWADKAGFKATTPDGRLIGPFNAFLLHPEVAPKFLAFDAALASHSSLSERVREVVILAVGGVWSADYELYAHSILARNAGISPDAIKSLASGELPDRLGNDEEVAARVARELSTKHRIDDALFAEAEKLFAKQGLFEIAALIGEYHTTCTILNLFAVPAPE